MTRFSDLVLSGGWAVARREDPEPTIGYFRDLAWQHPGDASALFEYAGALDFAGREAEAAPVYEQAFSAGLDGDDLRRGLIQYGSTLRNLGRFDEAVQIMRRADEQFPGHDSITAFLALALQRRAVPGGGGPADRSGPGPDRRRRPRELRVGAPELRR
jgi:tetratricopeptide (TPR) repeat protein